MHMPNVSSDTGGSEQGGRRSPAPPQPPHRQSHLLGGLHTPAFAEQFAQGFKDLNPNKKLPIKTKSRNTFPHPLLLLPLSFSGFHPGKITPQELPFNLPPSHKEGKQSEKDDAKTLSTCCWSCWRDSCNRSGDEMLALDWASWDSIKGCRAKHHPVKGWESLSKIWGQKCFPFLCLEKDALALDFGLQPYEMMMFGKK